MKNGKHGGAPALIGAGGAGHAGRGPPPPPALGPGRPAFKGTEAVLTFQSGFTANTGVIPTITGEADLIVSDALNHASIIDGIRLSTAPRTVFPHPDVEA